LRHAESDLILARIGPRPGILLEMLCFHAQQAVEKALKAVLVSKGVPPTRTHSISALLDHLPADVIAPEGVLLLPF
jgi:HEPN domain-containing protein